MPKDLLQVTDRKELEKSILKGERERVHTLAEQVKALTTKLEEFSSQNQYGRRTELTPENGPPTSTCMAQNMHAHTHNKNI